MKKLYFCLKNLDNKVPNRVKSTQLWNFCEFFLNILRNLATTGSEFPCIFCVFTENTGLFCAFVLGRAIVFLLV